MTEVASATQQSPVSGLHRYVIFVDTGNVQGSGITEWSNITHLHLDGDRGKSVAVPREFLEGIKHDFTYFPSGFVQETHFKAPFIGKVGEIRLGLKDGIESSTAWKLGHIEVKDEDVQRSWICSGRTWVMEDNCCGCELTFTGDVVEVRHSFAGDSRPRPMESTTVPLTTDICDGDDDAERATPDTAEVESVKEASSSDVSSPGVANTDVDELPAILERLTMKDEEISALREQVRQRDEKTKLLELELEEAKRDTNVSLETQQSERLGKLRSTFRQSAEEIGRMKVNLQ